MEASIQIKVGRDLQQQQVTLKSNIFTTGNKMNKKLIIGITITTVIGILGLFITGFFEDEESTQSGGNKFFITTNPIDLTQIFSISQFRSCMGHDYSGKNVDGQIEKNRSMKHYITVTQEFDQSAGKVKVFAPFNGKITSVKDEQNPRGNQVWLEGNTAGWNFIFFHIDLLPNIAKGSEINAGELIGYANLKGGANFDFGVKSFGFGGQKFDSPFNYMSADVLSEYAKVGIDPDNILIPKETRDASPCDFDQGSREDEQIFIQ